MRLLTTLFFFSVLFNTSIAQHLDRVQGDILVRMYEGYKPQTVLKNFKSFRGISTEIALVKEVSAYMNIYRLHFDWTKISETDILKAIKNDRSVMIAQFNHLTKLRQTVPNDPQFLDQWQYINTGQDGGLVGADIDMDLAWDVTTGGLTIDGDTIVVCIVDDGIDFNHPDMMANLWKNRAEIPDNGIDDDLNGYVDDFDGWDTGSSSDDVGDGGFHGTSVAGIVGAVGNNEIGVAGVNWNVKLMIVQGGTGVESEVLEAYSYPLSFRKKYNETNGAEGAFVVATNSSWGVDFGQPEDAPLWCSFYDTLGVHGILSCGATINGNTNVDDDGDLPTACSSEYLITVTNMNRNDVKVTGAGFGIETIDLGAFGQDTWTVDFGGGYDGFGGTSGATPHVAGTIGLLYAAPCNTLMSIAKSDPAEASRLVRDYILNGVDLNASLEGITKTGGRLNVNNAMMDVMNNCGPCPPPSSLGTKNITDQEATVSWNTIDSVHTTNLEYRFLGDTIWISEDSVQSPVTLNNLLACATYEFRVIGFCTDTNNISQVKIFMTDGCCDAPSDVTIEMVTLDSVPIIWNKVIAANSYQVILSDNTNSTLDTFSTSEFSLILTPLSPCTEYSFVILSDCDTSSSINSTQYSFRTKGCGPCTDLEYCEAKGNSTNYEWIESFSIGDYENVSGNNAGYFLFEDENISLVPGFTYESTIAQGGFTFAENYRIYIDYDQDGEFNPETELVFGNVVNNGSASGDISLPIDALVGFTRMRVIMQFGGQIDVLPCVEFNEGEVEDYCVNILDPNTVCGEIDSMRLEAIATDSTKVVWNQSRNSIAFNYRFKELGTTDWEPLATVDTFVLVSDLVDCRTYEFQVQSICPADTSQFSDSFTFESNCSTHTNDFSENNPLTIFPNPFTNKIDLRFEDILDTEVSFSLIDLNGKIIQSKIISPNLGNSNTVLFTELGGLSSGIYFIQIKDQSSQSLVKIIKM